MASLIHLVCLNMVLHLCYLKSLALVQVWLWSTRSISLSFGDVLALIKHRFHAPTCRVNVWNDHVFTLSTNLAQRFYCLFDFRNIGAKLEHFKKLQGNVEFYQNKCHPRNAPDMRRPCAKATDMWAQWLADQPQFAASHEFPWRLRSPRGGGMEPKACSRWRPHPMAGWPHG
jgi:hypothetical protein